MVEVIINWCNIPEMQANIARLFACCASAPDNDPPGSEDESPEVKMSGVPAVHGVLAGLRAVTKMNDMPLPLDTVEEPLAEPLTPRISFDTDSMSRRTDDEYDELVAEGSRCASREDWHRAARAFREAIALRPDEPVAHLKLGVALSNSSWHDVEAAQLLSSSVPHRAPAQQQLGASARRFEAATSGCDGFLIDLDGTMYQPGGLLPGAREFYWWLVDSGTCHMHMHMHM